MHEQARISFYLSEQGRKDSLRLGGDGKHQQMQFGIVKDPTELELFAVDEEGQVSFDATISPKTFEPDDKHTWLLTGQGGEVRTNVLWNVVPSWHDLLQFARWAHDIRKQQDDEYCLEMKALVATQDRVAYAFLADPNARAEKISEDYVTIAGHDFWSTDGRVVVEARARSAQDAEELKRANRATLAEWTAKHGTENQRQRLAAGLLPWQEVYDAAHEHLYAPLAEFALYRRYSIEEVCECVALSFGEKPCKVKFQSVDAVELTAAEWDRLSKIRAALPDATFQLREHRAECQSALPRMKRGVIVKVSLGKLTFKREFALTENSRDTF